MMTMESTEEAVKTWATNTTATLYLVFHPSLHMPFNDHSCEEVKEELCKYHSSARATTDSAEFANANGRSHFLPIVFSAFSGGGGGSAWCRDAPSTPVHCSSAGLLGNVEMALCHLNYRELIYAINIVQYLTSGDKNTTFREGRINMDSRTADDSRAKAALYL